jgi:tRNA G10  N-methylase Trm11
MTGTGGFVIEAALMGRNAVAIDLEQEMVDGARKNVLWALECEGITSTKQFEIIEGDATDLINSVPKRWHKKISGLVLDPPYGRNSHGSITHFDLIRNTLNSFRDIASNDATIVLILPIHPLKESKLEVKQDSDEIILLHGEWRDFQKLLVECNWKVEGLWIEHVHSSLGRLILHASNALQG